VIQLLKLISQKEDKNDQRIYNIVERLNALSLEVTTLTNELRVLTPVQNRGDQTPVQAQTRQQASNQAPIWNRQLQVPIRTLTRHKSPYFHMSDTNTKDKGK
jgi:hypothetical protein